MFALIKIVRIFGLSTVQVVPEKLAKMKTAQELQLNTSDLWMEKANGYGQYNVCLINLDGTISSMRFTDSHTWDAYQDIEDAEEALVFLLSIPSINHWVSDKMDTEV